MKFIFTATVIFFVCLLPHHSNAQFSPSMQFSSSSMKLDWKMDGGSNMDDIAQISSVGFGPAVSMESKRFLFQGAVLRHFNSDGGSLIGEDFSGSLTRIPSEFFFVLGYKINAHKNIQYYPIFTYGRYHLRLKTETIVDDVKTTETDNIIFDQFGGGLGAQYRIEKLKFDLQAKVKSASGRYQGGDFIGADLSIGLSVGYIL
ncbi:MAG: hypothetical protein AAFQ94_05475 [Bacteroidota bacterium]